MRRSIRKKNASVKFVKRQKNMKKMKKMKKTLKTLKKSKHIVPILPMNIANVVPIKIDSHGMGCCQGFCLEISKSKEKEKENEQENDNDNDNDIDNDIVVLLKTRKGTHYSALQVQDRSTTFSYANFMNKFIQNLLERNMTICILGFACGSQALELCKYGNVARIDGVDTDPDMFRAFKTLLLLTKQNEQNNANKIQCYESDAESFLHRISPETRYDIIIDDVFVEFDKVPISYDFMASKLKPGGYLLINVIEENDLKRCIFQVNHAFKHVQLIRFDNGNNCIICQKV